MPNVWITLSDPKSGVVSTSPIQITGTVPQTTTSGKIQSVRIGTSTFTVNQASGATLSVSPASLNFAMSNGVGTGPQTITVNFTGGAGVAWTATSNQSKIIVAQGSGTGNGSFQVSASSGPNGHCTVNRTRRLRFAGWEGNSREHSNAPLSNPFGRRGFARRQHSLVWLRGFVVNGCLLDAVEVLRVDIWREPVGSEPAGALIFIGDAIFVYGARPDVESLNPNVPFNYRAGWGYQLLTNFLPHGNGTFKLHAIAHNDRGFARPISARKRLSSTMPTPPSPSAPSTPHPKAAQRPATHSSTSVGRLLRIPTRFRSMARPFR